MGVAQVKNQSRENKKNSDWRTYELPTERKRTIKDVQDVGSIWQRELGRKAKKGRRRRWKMKRKDETNNLALYMQIAILQIRGKVEG